MAYALWIRHATRDGAGWRLRGCPLATPDYAADEGAFEGAAFLCGPGARREPLSVALVRGRIDGEIDDVYAGTLTPCPSSLEQVLLTDDPALRTVYDGPVRFRPSPLAEQLGKGRNVLQISAETWCGILERSAASRWKTSPPYRRLRAFSTSKQIVLNGPVHFPAFSIAGLQMPARPAGLIEVDQLSPQDARSRPLGLH